METKLTVIVLTKNEEKNLTKCLESLKWCDQILVVDDNSTDDTIKIAKKSGVTVLAHSLADDFASQRNWAVSQAKTPWVLFVDADEVVSPQLAMEIQSAVTKLECKGFLVPRLDHMWGRTLRHGDVGNVRLLRLARRGAGEWTGKVHESWIIDGQMCSLKSPLNHYPHPTIVEFLQSINHYSSLRAKEMHAQGRKTNLIEVVLGPKWRFFQAYILKLGFLDGTAGFVHAMIMAFNTFLTAGKLYMYDRNR